MLAQSVRQFSRGGLKVSRRPFTPLAVATQHQPTPLTRTNTPARHFTPFASPEESRNFVQKSLRHLGTKDEVQEFFDLYSSLGSEQKFAVIKVAGGVLEKDLDSLASCLALLSQAGLYPVVLHGGAPQIGDALEAAGLESKFEGGLRVTSPEHLAVVRRTLRDVNLQLVQALQDRGTAASSVTSGVFEVGYKDKEKLKCVGQVTNVDVTSVEHCLRSKSLPIIPCLGETAEGQILNLNADSAAHALAQALRPVKTIYLTEEGGLVDAGGDIIPNVSFDTDYESIMAQTLPSKEKVQLGEIHELLSELPESASVAITSAAELPKELFTYQGSGTLLRGLDNVHSTNDVSTVDMKQVVQVIEGHGTGAKISPAWEGSLVKRLDTLYYSENYRGIAVVTKEDGLDGVSYLDKFITAKMRGSEAAAETLWETISAQHPKIFWRSVPGLKLNDWFFKKAQGSVTKDGWVLFWTGFDDLSTVEQCVDNVIKIPKSRKRSHAPQY